MKARKLLAMVAGISILTLAIAVPASAATPPTLKIGARGVEYAFETFSTNCPGAYPTVVDAFKKAARTETRIAQNYLDPFWCFGHSLNPAASRVGPLPAPIAHRDYNNKVVPARTEVEPGAKGSLAYANRLRAERGAPQLVVAADGTVIEAAGGAGGGF